MAKISDILTPLDESEITAQVNVEYGDWLQYVQTWRQDTKDVAKTYLVPKPKKNKVKIHLVRNKLKIRLSTLVSDEMSVEAVVMNGRLWEQNAENFNKVAKANYKSMKLRNKLISAYTDDALKWVWVLTVSGWNDHSQEPIISYIDSRACIPDPKNWQDNCMRFFWTELRLKLRSLLVDDAYDNERVKLVQNTISDVLRQIDIDNWETKNLNITFYQKWLVDAYNALTVFQPIENNPKWETYLRLLTYWADRSTLIRAVKMRALTPLEHADPTQIDFWVKLFRAEPIQWSWAWATLIDDVWAYQTVETYLTNLTIDQAAKAAFGWKTIVDSRLWIDTDQLANAEPAWSVISSWTITDPNISISGWIYQEPVSQPNPWTQNTIALVDNLADKASSTAPITSWQSARWDQTKAEIQTISQNINQQLSFMASNYMESLQWLWESIYRSYAANMSPQRKKHIVVVDSWEKDAYWFKKKEFISKWDFYIVIKSKTQERIKQQQQFAVFFSLIGIMLQWKEPWSSEYNALMRILWDKSWIEWFNSERFFPLSIDERKAYENLELLNNDIELKTKPLPWEDHNVYIQVYKTWLDTKARNNAIELREQILSAEPKQVTSQEDIKDTWWAARWLWASMLASDNAKNWWVNSLADVQV